MAVASPSVQRKSLRARFRARQTFFAANDGGGGGGMKVAHMAIKVDDPAAAGEFHETVPARQVSKARSPLCLRSFSGPGGA